MKKGSQKEPLYQLVYSTDPPKAKICSGCQRPVGECCCGVNPNDLKCKPVVSFERKGRGGKSVTLVSRLPKNQKFLDDMTTVLKKKVGAGGTSYILEEGGVIEIQGDKRDSLLKQVESYLNSLVKK